MTHTLSHRQILDIATCMGYYILQNGGEISRAEDTVERIGLAYGMDAVHAFAISSTIVVSAEKGGESLSQSRRIKKPVTNLHKVELYNALSRKICETHPSYDEIVESLRAIHKEPGYPLPIAVFSQALIGGAFAVFFGGGLVEFIIAFLIGAVLKLVLHLADFLQSPPFFANVVGSAVTVFLSFLSTFVFPGINTETVNIGVLMNLVPGVLLTNCIRDFIAMDYVAGLAKITEALLVAGAIAMGVALSILWR